MKQTEAILRHLRLNGSITPLEALQQYGCFRLAARISDLKAAGHPIATEMVVSNGKHHARYILDEQPQQLAMSFGSDGTLIQGQP